MGRAGEPSKRVGPGRNRRWGSVLHFERWRFAAAEYCRETAFGNVPETATKGIWIGTKPTLYVAARPLPVGRSSRKSCRQRPVRKQTGRSLRRSQSPPAAMG